MGSECHIVCGQWEQPHGYAAAELFELDAAGDDEHCQQQIEWHAARSIQFLGADHRHFGEFQFAQRDTPARVGVNQPERPQGATRRSQLPDRVGSILVQ